jgi:hypothetical protein
MRLDDSSPTSWRPALTCEDRSTRHPKHYSGSDSLWKRNCKWTICTDLIQGVVSLLCSSWPFCYVPLRKHSLGEDGTEEQQESREEHPGTMTEDTRTVRVQWDGNTTWLAMLTNIAQFRVSFLSFCTAAMSSYFPANQQNGYKWLRRNKTESTTSSVLMTDDTHATQQRVRTAAALLNWTDPKRFRSDPIDSITSFRRVISNKKGRKSTTEKLNWTRLDRYKTRWIRSCTRPS